MVGIDVEEPSDVDSPHAMMGDMAERHQTSQTRYVEDFFEHLFGFKERSLSYGEVQERFAASEDGTALISKTNDRKFKAGLLEFPSLGALREESRCAAAEDFGSRSGEVSLRVEHVVTNGALEDHAIATNAGSLFQVASQFNCLEFTSSKRIPEEGISGYVHDATQGPACAVACAPATVFRNYLVPVIHDGMPEAQHGQTAELQLNTLSGVEAFLENGGEVDDQGHGRYFWLRNGYMCSDARRLSALKAKLEELGEDGRDKLRASLKVGVAFGSEVTFSALVPFEGLVPMVVTEGVEGGDQSSPHTVSQVFSAAANVKTHDTTPEDWEPFARLLLEATYEAALWAGVRNARIAAKSGAPVPPGSRRVCLTLVGGGVFGNRLEWIVDAINFALQALVSAAPDKGWGLEVQIAHFESINLGVQRHVYIGAPRMETMPEWICASCTCGNSELSDKCRVCSIKREHSCRVGL